jgi:hypothetical protein
MRVSRAPLQSQCPMTITARRLVSRHPSQYPEAHGPSVPRSGPLTFNPSRATSITASGPPGPQPSESQRALGGHPTPASRAFAPRSAKRPPPRHSVRLGNDHDPGPRLHHWGLRHWPTSRARGGKAQWRRSETSFPNRLAAARSRAWRRWRGTTDQQQKWGPSGLRILNRRRDPVVAAEHRRGGAATCAHAITRVHCAHCSVASRTPLSWRAHYGHGVHASVTARTLLSQRARFDYGAHCTVTARTLRSRRARFGHGAHASVTARMLRSRRARYGHGVHVSIAVRAARHGRHCGHSEPGGLCGATNTARAAERVAKLQQAGQLRAAQAWRVEPPVAMAISFAQAGDSRAGCTSTASV